MSSRPQAAGSLADGPGWPAPNMCLLGKAHTRSCPFFSREAFVWHELLGRPQARDAPMRRRLKEGMLLIVLGLGSEQKGHGRDDGR